MSWNYRITKEVRYHKYLHEPETLYCVREVYYDKDGKVNGISEMPDIIGNNIQEVQDTLQRMIQCCQKPVINYDSGEEIHE